MTTLLRSISTKIFGIAVGLLLVMLIVSGWSASAIDRVSHQLRTLGQSIIPLALDVQNLRHAITEEKLGIAQHLPEGPAACRAAMSAGARAAARELGKARADVRQGQQIAITDKNRTEFARMMPLLDQLGSLYDRHRQSADRLCDAPADTEARRDHATDTDLLEKAIDAVSAEIELFTRATATIVESRESGAMRANFLLIGITSVVGLFLAYCVSRSVTRPIARLREGTRAVEAGRLDGEVPVTSSDEVGDVTRAFNDMLAGLRSKEKIKETFGQYVDPRVVAQLIDGEASATRAGTKQVATLFFSDIVGFTALSESLTPAMLVTMVNEYFATMSAPIRAFDGIIDKYIGDAIMAFWVPPFADPEDQALLACRAALTQRDLLADFNARLPDLLGWRKAPLVANRMSVTTGEVVVGSIGPGFARSFTVMGDTVNLASRLEGANKAYGTCIIVDPETVRQAGDQIETRLLDTIRVAGRDGPLDIYELLGIAGSATLGQQAVCAAYAEALDWYRDGRWSHAEDGFVRALALDPEDGPSAAMLGRIRGMSGVAPEEWAGVWRMQAK